MWEEKKYIYIFESIHDDDDGDDDDDDVYFEALRWKLSEAPGWCQIAPLLSVKCCWWAGGTSGARIEGESGAVAGALSSFFPFIQRQLVLSVGWPCSWYKLWWGTRGGGVESWVAGIVLWQHSGPVVVGKQRHTTRGPRGPSTRTNWSLQYNALGYKCNYAFIQIHTETQTWIQTRTDNTQQLLWLKYADIHFTTGGNKNTNYRNSQTPWVIPDR